MPMGLSAASGFLSVDLTWDDPSDSSITGYEYQVNHNDTYTGGLSGWSSWSDIPNSDASTTSHTFSGLGKNHEYRYKIRAVNAVGAGKQAPAADPWYVSAVPTGPPPPPPVTQFLADRRCDHYFRLHWKKVSGATGYDLNISKNHRKSWERLLTNKNSNGFKVSKWTKNHTFYFAVRSVNEHDASAWTNLTSAAPPCAVEGLEASYASSGDMSVSWNPAKRAESYSVSFSSDNGKSWQQMVTGLKATTYTFNKDPNAVPYSPDFRVGVQSRKGGLGSPWQFAPITHAGGAYVSNLGETPTGTVHGVAGFEYAAPFSTDGAYSHTLRGVTVKFGAKQGTPHNIAVKIYEDSGGIPGAAVANLTLSGTSSPSDEDAEYTCSGSGCALSSGATYHIHLSAGGSGHYRWKHTTSDSETTEPSTGVGLSIGNHGQFRAGSGGNWNNVSGSEVGMFKAAVTLNPKLSASGIGTRTATLRLTGKDGGWWFKETSPNTGSCTEGEADFTNDLTGLSAGTTQTFTAYGDSACASAISTTTFTTLGSLTISNKKATSATLNLAGHNGQWWYDADTGPHTACQGPVAAGTSSADLTGLTIHQQYTYTAYDAAGCNSADELVSITFEPSGDVLEVESVTATTATLKLSHHTGNWWFKRTAPDAGTCTAGESDFTNDLTGLTPGTEYTYKSYSANTCADAQEGDSVDFTTGGVSVSNLDTTGSTATCHVGHDQGGVRQCAASFTTGNEPNGYTLHSIDARFNGTIGSPTGFNIALHTASDQKPSSSAISNATLSGDTPTFLGGIETYTCSGDGCQLSANTEYYVVMTTSDTSGTNIHIWQLQASGSETKIPSTNRWSIADDIKRDQNFGTTYNYAGVMKIAATVNASLTATVSNSLVTLTLTDGPSDWWFKIGDSGTCTEASGSTVSGIGGYTGTHSVKAYSDNACSAEIASTSFTVPPSLTASGISGTGATLTVGGHSGDWYYKGISGTEASTSCVTVSGSVTKALSGLTADKLYGYTAYSGSSCTGTELGTDYFSTNDFDVGNLGEAASSGSCLVGYSGGSRKCAMAFTTGDRSGGYTLKSVTAEFIAKVENGTLGNIIVAIHAADTTNSANPATTAKVTLSGNDPDTAGLYSYTCTGSDCSLTKDTTYFVVMSTADTSGNDFYRARLTEADAEAGHPSGNGWEIADVGRAKNGSNAWGDLASSRIGLLHIAADD